MAPERRRWFFPWLVVTAIGLAVYAAAWRHINWNPERVPQFLTVAMWWGWVPVLALPFFLTGKLQSFVIVVLIVACVPLSLVAGLAMLFGSRDKVVLSDAPTGQPALIITMSSGFLGGSCLHVQQSTALGFVLQPVGNSHCASNHGGDFLPFATRSARFERFPQRGLIALVADSTQTTSNRHRYVELYRVSGGKVTAIDQGASDSGVVDRIIREQLSGTASP